MFYSIDLLSLRKKGKFSRCWLAATLSDRMLKKTLSNKIILSIDILVTCNEIMKVMHMGGTNKQFRFSLYMSAQLLLGTIKLFKLQVTIFQDSLFRMKPYLNPIDMAPMKRMKITEAALNDETLPDEPPILTPNFENIHLREDLHLMPEIGLETIQMPELRNFVESPNFGALVDDEFDFMILNEGDIRMFVTEDIHARTIDASKEQPRSPENTTELHNLGLSDAPPVIDESATAGIYAQLQRTPQKRQSNTTNLDTPTKRLRRGLRYEINAAAEDGIRDFPIDLPADVEVHPLDEFVELPRDVEVQPINESIGLMPEAPSAPALPVQESTMDITAPANIDLHLETLELETPRRPRRRIRKLRRFDEDTEVPEASTGKGQFRNFKQDTIRSFVPPVPDRKREMLADMLLMNSQTNRHHNRATDHLEWADKLISNYDLRSMGPFVAENDDSISFEVIRLMDSEVQSRSAEISKTHGDSTNLEASSQNRTVDDCISVEHDTMARPFIPEVSEDIIEVPMDIALADITNEPMLQNNSEIPENVPLPEIEMPPIPQNNEKPSEMTTISIANLPQSDARASTMTNGQSTSEPNTEDTDAFLPPKLRKKNFGKKTSYEKSSTREAIIDTCDSPVSMRSLQSEHSTWTIPELIAYLDIFWSDRRMVRLEDLIPRDTTKKIDAGACFKLLLVLMKERKVMLRQDEPYSTIYIYKMMPDGSSMDW